MVYDYIGMSVGGELDDLRFEGQIIGKIFPSLVYTNI